MTPPPTLADDSEWGFAVEADGRYAGTVSAAVAVLAGGRPRLHRDRTEVLATGAGVGWAVADRQTDLLVGSVALFDLSPSRTAEIGYWTHPDARGRGVMSEAVALASRHAFASTESGGLSLRLLTVMAAESNQASRRVIEVNGFRHWGNERLGTTTRNGPVDVARYDLQAEEFAALGVDAHRPRRGATT